MKDTQNVDLYKSLLAHIKKMHDVIDYRISLNDYRFEYNINRRRQYPAMSVGAEYKGEVAFGDHHAPVWENGLQIMVVDALLGYYKKLDIQEPISRNHVGRCAENYASSKVIKKLDGKNKKPLTLSEIAFTDAINPRTLMIKDWCSICHSIFD